MCGGPNTAVCRWAACGAFSPERKLRRSSRRCAADAGTCGVGAAGLDKPPLHNCVQGHRHPHYKRGQAALAAWLAVCVRRRRAGGGTAGYVGLLFILLSRMSQGVFMHQGVKAAAQFSAISAFAQSLIAHHLLTSINQTPITMQAHAAFLSGSAALPRPATQVNPC